jgi:hypothetical protein
MGWLRLAIGVAGHWRLIAAYVRLSGGQGDICSNGIESDKWGFVVNSFCKVPAIYIGRTMSWQRRNCQVAAPVAKVMYK